MNIAFRVDASLAIGSGHVVRCLTLADALQAAGASCRFVCRPHPGHMLGVIERRGHRAHALPPADPRGSPKLDTAAPVPYADWLGSDWASDARQTQALLAGTPFDALIVDHYAIDHRWQSLMRPYCRRLLVIDDLADRRHDCDLLIDQNLGRRASDYAGRTPAGCRLLIGPQYALLRPEFAALRADSLRRRASAGVSRLLITLGGVDRDNVTGAVLNALRHCTLPADCRVSVVMGAQAPWLQSVRQQAALLPWASELLVDVADMAHLMAASDIAIGAAGSTAWERCCLGLPTLALVLAPNQRGGAAALADAGAAIGLSDDLDRLAGELDAALARVSRPEILHAMQAASAAVSDGMGVPRVIQEVCHAAG